MESIAFSLMTAALKTAAMIALPAVIAVASVGVVIAIVQTVVQVQDQNVAFAPKLLAVAIIGWLGGPEAFDLLRTLLVDSMRALPGFAHA